MKMNQKRGGAGAVFFASRFAIDENIGQLVGNDVEFLGSTAAPAIKVDKMMVIKVNSLN